MSKQLCLHHPSLAVYFTDSQHDSFDVKIINLYFGKMSCLFCFDLEYQQDSVVRENPPSELTGQLPTGSGMDRFVQRAVSASV